ncbi:MAG: F0F1 ATP synthase subunit A [Acidobacteria bacterium]|nr:F0F1 ATP synthase subunit A [Acidobacteriota bacterium]
MPEHELGITAFFNDNFAGVANSFLTMVGRHAADRPWSNWMVMQLLIALIVVVIFGILKPRISMDKPGGLQHLFEVVYTYLEQQAREIIGPHYHRYLHLCVTIFFFVLFSNLIGIIPAFESPTMFPPVTLGLALISFLYYNIQGIRAQGAWNYAKHFAGPMWQLAFLMIPIEIVSHFARPLSLTIRLYANMFAGEQVTVEFMKMVPLFVPVIFMALHIFVSFLQAYVFALMTMIYVSSAVEHHAEEHH